MDFKRFNLMMDNLVQGRFFSLFYISTDLFFCAVYLAAFWISLYVYEDNFIWVLFFGFARLESVICVSALSTAIRLRSQNNLPLYACKICGMPLTFVFFWMSSVAILLFPISHSVAFACSSLVFALLLFIYFVFLGSRIFLLLVIRAMVRISVNAAVDDVPVTTVENMMSMEEDSFSVSGQTSQSEEIDFFVNS